MSAEKSFSCADGTSPDGSLYTKIRARRFCGEGCATEGEGLGGVGRCEALCARFPARTMSDTASPFLRRIQAGFGQLQLQAGEREVGCLAPTPGFTSSGNAGRSRGCGHRGTGNLRWVACASCFEIVGCSAWFARYFGALTGVAALVRNCVAKQ